MAKKKRRPITTDHLISTLVYMRGLTDAMIATLMASTGTDFPELPQPLYMEKAYDKDCPPPEDKAYEKDCPPPEEPPQTPTRSRFRSCPRYVVMVPVRRIKAKPPRRTRK